MTKRYYFLAVVMLSIIGTHARAQQQPPQPAMTFFVTSTRIGMGGNLGGLAGADKHCQTLAAAVGAGNRAWRAYLSTQGPNAVNARDRIGNGPWHSATGALIARNVADLHGDTVEAARLWPNINKQDAVTEKGEIVPGRQDPVNFHDMLTGSQPDGRAFPPTPDRTCQNWTSSAAGGSAQLGHHDRIGGGTHSWNSAHETPGCSQELFGYDGRFYCFAVN
jgi:hypothetical protein